MKIESFLDIAENIEAFNLPLFLDASFKYSININQKDFTFWYKWNNLFTFWSLEIYDQYNNLLATTKIVPNWNLYHNYQYLFELNTPYLLSYNEININDYPTQFTLEDEYKLSVTNITFEAQ